jgi:hypothetical protein
MNHPYRIIPPRTGKNKIKHPKLSEAGVIPKLGSSILLVGVTKSGKSCLLYNLLSRPEFFGNAFDKIFVISPSGDDTLEDLDIEEECKFTDLKKGIEAIKAINKHQKIQIAKHGNHKAHQFALVLDDCIGDSKFMKSPEVIQSFIANRHYNNTVFLCSQHLRSVPKVCRLQSSYVCIFQCSRRECQTLFEEFCPPGMNSKQFEKLLDDIWSEPYQFLTIHRLADINERYRKGLAEPVDLDYYRSL